MGETTCPCGALATHYIRFSFTYRQELPYKWEPPGPYGDGKSYCPPPTHCETCAERATGHSKEARVK